jgi:hypothetical protein
LAGLAAVVMTAMVKADTAIAIPTLFDKPLVFAGIESLPQQTQANSTVGRSDWASKAKIVRCRGADRISVSPIGVVEYWAANQQYGHSE